MMKLGLIRGQRVGPRHVTARPLGDGPQINLVYGEDWSLEGVLCMLIQKSLKDDAMTKPSPCGTSSTRLWKLLGLLIASTVGLTVMAPQRAFAQG